MKHSKTKRPQQHRRSHSSIDLLPVKLRIAVEKMIVNNQWPSDFRNHFNGTPRHCDIVAYCERKGCKISKSAIGRFAQQIQKVSALKIINDFRSYIISYLGVLCAEFSSIQADLETSIADDGLNELEKLREKKIDRIEEVVANLRKLDNSYPNPIQGG